MRILAFVFVIFFMGKFAAAAERFRLAVTTSFDNSGLTEVLLPAIRKDLDLDIQLLIVGTGQALRLGMAGDVDALLVHARSAEEAFVAAGYAPYRREIMYNDFIVIGPKEDPVRVAEASNIKTVFERLADGNAVFVSRGDDSGTHKREQTLWPQPPVGDWYREIGAGMGAALNMSAAIGAYTLSDRASWLNFANKQDLEILYAGDQRLFNQYTYLPVSAERHPHIKAQAAKRLEDWLMGPTAKALINGYRVNGQWMFFFNAKELGAE